MGEGLGIISFLLWIASLVCIVVALINPEVFSPIFKKNLGRMKTTSILFCISIGLMIVFGIFAVNSPSSSSNAQSKSQAKTSITVPNNKPTTPQETAKNKPTSAPTVTPFASLNSNASGITVQNNTDYALKYCDLFEEYVPYTPGVKMDFSGEYEHGIGNDIPSHQSVFVSWADMTLSDGTRFNYFKKSPQDLNIKCKVNGKDLSYPFTEE